MKIGILTRRLKSEFDTPLNSIPFTYLDVIKKECYPIIIDSSLCLETYKNELLQQIKDISGFVLPGGESISDVDLFIIDYCHHNNIPLLGICLGMQEIAYYFNKKSIVPLNSSSHMDMNADYVHKIELTNNGYLNNLLKVNYINVNSRHNYHIKDNDNYTIEATYENVIEAIKVKNTKYILGLQFHPEIMYFYDNYAKIIFTDFFYNCRK